MEKKLKLKKEMLKRLSAELLRNVAGGASDTGLGPVPDSAVAGTVDACNIVL